MEKEKTPEGKLLRLIKAKRTAAAAPAAQTEEVSAETEGTGAAEERPAVEKAVKPVGRRRERLTARKPVFTDASPEERRAIFIRIFPTLLMVLCLIVVIYLIADTFFITPHFRRKVESASVKAEAGEKAEARPGVSAEKTVEEEPTKPYSYYSKNIDQRDIFRPITETQKKETDAGVQGIRDNLTLIGVIAGEDLQAAIEDKKNNKTYFVYKGDYIEDILVEDILVNKVILEYRGEKFELML